MQIFTRHPSPKRRYSETIVFVHQFGGAPYQLKKHIDFVNELGFDAASFQLKFNQVLQWVRFPISSNMRIGFRHVWEDQIEAVLNAVVGPKIVYSFSMPSCAAAVAISRRRASEVSGWITEGGPYLQLKKCFWNYTTHIWKMKNPLLKTAAVLAGYEAAGGAQYESDLLEALKAMPDNFPVLSVIYWQDALVPTAAIEDAFKSQRHLGLETLALPDAAHLRGLADSPEDYKPRIKRFLSRHAHPLESESIAKGDRHSFGSGDDHRRVES